MAEIYQLPDNGSGNANAGGIPFSIPIGTMAVFLATATTTLPTFSDLRYDRLIV